MPQQRSTFTAEFKKQMVQLFESGGERAPSFTQRKSAPKDGKRHFKASRVDHGTKVNVIRQNAHKYSVSAMCEVLQLPRSTYYYKPVPAGAETRAGGCGYLYS